MPLPIGTRDAILAASDLREEVYEVPEWNCSLRLRGLTLAELNNITRLSTGKSGELNNLRMNVFMFTRGVIEPQFLDENYEELIKKSAVVLRVALRIAELSGVGPAGVQAALKNSESAPSDGLNSN